MEKQPPNIDSRLRHILRMPQEIYQASGIIVNGRRLKSFVFTTDLAIIRNCDADAVFAVYPFITVTKFGTDFEARIEAGASILNIAAAAQTPELVREARKALPDVPIIATGGKTGESILRTIESGANAITYTPPSTYELFQEMMKGYRE